jgi:hypothetical protein
MGTFAETAIVDYRLEFAEQGKQTFLSVCNKQTEVCRFRFPSVDEENKTEVIICKRTKWACHSERPISMSGRLS